MLFWVFLKFEVKQYESLIRVLLVQFCDVFLPKGQSDKKQIYSFSPKVVNFFRKMAKKLTTVGGPIKKTTLF